MEDFIGNAVMNTNQNCQEKSQAAFSKLNLSLPPGRVSHLSFNLLLAVYSVHVWYVKSLYIQTFQEKSMDWQQSDIFPRNNIKSHRICYINAICLLKQRLHFQGVLLVASVPQCRLVELQLKYKPSYNAPLYFTS